MSGRSRHWINFILNAAWSCGCENRRVTSDWPQWRGPMRNGCSLEEDLVDGWGTAGPVELWRYPLGTGYSGLAICNGRLFTMVQDDAEYVLALDAQTGRELWRVRSDSSYFHEPHDGPCGTPVVSDRIVYTVGAWGQFMATEAATGEVLWSHHLVRDVGGTMPEYGYATSQLVDGDRVFVEPGGHGGRSLAAFHRKTGELLWSVYGDPAGYSSPVVTDVGGFRHILFFTARHLVSVSAEHGRILWEIPWEAQSGVNAATPVLISPQRIFISSEDTGGAVLEIQSVGSSYTVEVAWKNHLMRNRFRTCLFLEGHLYGFDTSGLKCLNADTGEEKWCESGFGGASLIHADQKLLILSGYGEFVLAAATPVQFVELARAQVFEWQVPHSACARARQALSQKPIRGHLSRPGRV